MDCAQNHCYPCPFEVSISILNHIADFRLVQTNDRGHQPTFVSSVVNGKVVRFPIATARTAIRRHAFTCVRSARILCLGTRQMGCSECYSTMVRKTET